MQYKLKHPFEFEGRTYVAILLPDVAKVRHDVVSVRIAKMFAELRKEKHGTGEFLDDELGLPSEAMVRFKEIELASERLLIEGFCEDFPPAAIDELSIEDKDVICEHIKQLQNLSEKNSDQGKKSNPPKRSG